MTLPNGPKTHPSLQLCQWIGDPLKYLDTCADRYGPIFTTHWASLGQMVIVSSPSALQEILTNPALEAPGSLNTTLRPLVGEQSVMLLDGDRHRRERQLLMPPFHGERLKNYAQDICTIAQKITSQLAIGQPFIVRKITQTITLQIIMRVVFGLKDGPRFQKLQPLLVALLESVGTPLSSSILFFPWLRQDWGPWSPWGRMKRQHEKISELLFAEIQDARFRLDANRTDILSLMLAARDENGQPMTDRELHDELITLLLAGYETTASALAWACYWIHRLPQVREKMLQELDTLGENPDPLAISRLPYLTAVCQETLRINPVALLTFSRQVKQPFNLMGYDLEPGTIAIGSIYLAHRNEAIYPDPETFRPERFLERQFSPFEYLPFGGGSRRCIGLALAQLEMKLVLAILLRDYDLALAEPGPIRPKRRGITVGPAGGVRMVVKSRRTQQPRSQAVVATV